MEYMHARTHNIPYRNIYIGGSSHSGNGTSSTCNRNTKLMECWITHFLCFALFCFVCLKKKNWISTENSMWMVGSLPFFIFTCIFQLKCINHGAFWCIQTIMCVCVFGVWWQVVKEFWVILMLTNQVKKNDNTQNGMP